MTSAAPTILALETDSAWVVILAVSLVTAVAALLLRRLIARPGGLASGFLLVLPLLLPLVAALAYEQAVLPELRVMTPADHTLFTRSADLMHFLLLSDGRGTTIPYALTGSAGPWILLFAVGVSSVMLVRRVVGVALLHRLVLRCRIPQEPYRTLITETVRSLMPRMRIKVPPEVLLLPDGVSGAFAVGLWRPRILLSEDLLDELDADELASLLAHEMAHIEARDLPLVSAAGFLRDLMAWNPVAHLSLRKLILDRELEADRRAADLGAGPLAVASGLVKAFEVMRRSKTLRGKPALAFLRNRGLIKRRVARLLALADGGAVSVRSERMPYLMAALLVAVLGLQVGAKLANDRGALAIVVGESDARAWTPPTALRRAGATTPAPKVATATDLARPFRSAAFIEAAVKEKDLVKWAAWMRKQAASRLGVRAATLRWQARDSWQAVPIWSQTSMGLPIVIYRMELTTLVRR